MTAFKDGIVAVADDRVKVYDSSGQAFMDESLVMESPAVSATARRVLVFDRGGKVAAVFDSFSQKKKLTFEKSIIHYLIDLRISEAKNLLIETSMPCSVIAELVGFDDANYFSRIFKKRMGLSPLQFRVSAVDLNKSSN